MDGLGSKLFFDALIPVATVCLSFVLGLIATGIAWLIKSVWQLQKDLDAAFSKIRLMEERHERDYR